MATENGGGLGSWVRRHPWIWIVLLYVFVLGINIAMMIIALMNQPTFVH